MPEQETFRFADFELDVAAYELRRDGRPLRIERQPMDVLIMLIERRGQLVSRSEIADRLWGKDVFVDIDTGVHTAIRKVRQALRDSAERPTFVETVPGKGYRFVAPVTAGSRPRDITTPPEPIKTPDTQRAKNDGNEGPAETAVVPAHRWRVAWLAAASAVLLILGLGIRSWVGGDPTFTTSVIRLAVLPFEDLNHQQDRQYLADGLTEDTIAMIGRIEPERLRVIGRTSTMAYKGTKKSLAEIGEELNVDYLVESSLITEDGKLRVTSKLIRVRDEVQLWSAVYDKEPAGILQVQRELSEAIAEQIHLRLSSGFAQAATDRHSRNSEAYDEYHRARFFENQRNPATLALAIQHYKRAIALDPDYALAWAGLAYTYGGGALNSDVAPRTVVGPMREAVENALRTGPNLSESQFVVGILKWLFEWDWTGAETALRSAVELDPGNAAAHLTLGHVLSQKGRHGEAMSMMSIARELEPFDPLNHALSSQVAFQKRDFQAAIEHAQRANRDGSGFWIGYMQLGQAYAETDKSELALEVLADAARRSDGNSKPTSLRGYIMARSGRTAEARDVLQILETRARTRYVPPYAYALVHAGLGEREATLEWLERAAATRDVHVIFLTVDPKWDPYRSDPRFRKILERCGFA